MHSLRHAAHAMDYIGQTVARLHSTAAAAPAPNAARTAMLEYMQQRWAETPVCSRGGLLSPYAIGTYVASNQPSPAMGSSDLRKFGDASP